MADVKTNLRQAENEVEVVGFLSEKNLTEQANDDGVMFISGTVTVKTSDVNFVRFTVRTSEKKNNGDDNPMYAGIKTVLDTYKSIAEVGEDEADFIRVRGNLNPYHSNQNNTDQMGYRANSFNRVPAGAEDAESRAEFKAELFIQSITPEIGRDESETGRVIVSGWMPTYNGIEPLKIVCDEDTADAVSSEYEPGQTFMAMGNIVNSRVVITKEVPVKIGKPRIETTTTYKNELVLTGATEAYEEGVSPVAPYEMDSIKLAVQERKDRIESAKNQSQPRAAANRNAARPSAKGTGRTLTF